jgi:hypothetical protein
MYSSWQPGQRREAAPTSAGASDAVTRLIKCIGERTGFALPVHAHMLWHVCGYALAPGESRIGSATSPSSTPTPRGAKTKFKLRVNLELAAGAARARASERQIASVPSPYTRLSGLGG